MNGPGNGGNGWPAAARPAALTMYSPLSAVLRRAPITAPLDATVRQALETMERSAVGSIVVVDAAGRVPVGIFTLQDLLRRVSLPGGDLGQPIATVMTSGLITLPPGATAYQAALAMARHGVRHLVVVERDGRLAGVVSQGDIFGLQRVGVREISGQIRRAADAGAQREAALEIHRLADRLIAQGVAVETLTQFVSTLNDLLTIQIIETTADAFDLPPVRMCWIALGSEGRLEQTFSTDQDNGIIFDADARSADEVRASLVPFARAVNERLAACGFPLCKGGIMAGNPRWCLTLDEWHDAFSGWIHGAEPQALVHAAIFFDLRPIYGDESLAELLRSWLLGAARDRPPFLRLMAENALRCRPPLGLFRDFAFDGSKEFPHTLDLKNAGSRLFVDSARVLGLAHVVPATSTPQRLRAAGEAAELSPESLAAIIDGFHFIHLLRLRNQRWAPAPRPEANRVDPRELNELDRRVLKEAFRQAQRLQGRLAARFQLASG